MHNRGRRGLTLALVSAATFGSSGSFGSSLLRIGWTPGAAVTIRVVIGALVLTVPALLQFRGRRALLTRASRVVVPYGVAAVAGAQLCYLNAVAHLSVGVALMLEYSGVLLVVAWMWLRHSQRPERMTLAGAALAVLGLVLVLDLVGSHKVDVVGIGWGFGAAIGLAVYFVVSAGTDEDLPPLVVAWGGLVVGGLALLVAGWAGILPLRAPKAEVVLAGTRVSWVVPVLGLSLLAAVVAYVAGVEAARLLGARLASVVGLAEVMFAVLFAWLLLAQAPGAITLVGGALVVGGIALVRFGEARAAPVEPLMPASVSSPS